MMNIGTIKMKTPGGKDSSIHVSLNASGNVDIVFMRTSEGELLTMLPHYAAKRLSELLAAACACTDAARPAHTERAGQS